MSSSPSPILDNRPIDKWKVTELKEELKRRRLTTRGLKEELVRRLDEALRVEQEETERLNSAALAAPVAANQEAEITPLTVGHTTPDRTQTTPVALVGAAFSTETTPSAAQTTPEPKTTTEASAAVDITPPPVFSKPEVNARDQDEKVDDVRDEAALNSSVVDVKLQEPQEVDVKDGVESGVTAADAVVIQKSDVEMENKETFSGLDGGFSKAQPTEAELEKSATDNQVSEVIPITGFEVKSDCISTDSVSKNEKIELKDNKIADNVKIEQNVNKSQEPSTVTGESHPMDVEKPLEQKISVGGGGDSDAANADMTKGKNIIEAGDSEKLNLDRSSGDESMDDEPETKQTESVTSHDVDKSEKNKMLTDKEESRADIMDVGKGEAPENKSHPLVASDKRKLPDNDQEAVGNNEPAKRQRRWNSGGIKVPEAQATNSTTPITTPRSTGLKREFARSDSSVSEDGPKERVVPPSTKEPTNSLRIDRFLRPFTLKAVQELLGKTGNVTSFWMDHIETHCYVSYSSAEEAAATREAVYNLQWPPNGGRLLIAEFVGPEEVKAKLEAPLLMSPRKGHESNANKQGTASETDCVTDGGSDSDSSPKKRKTRSASKSGSAEKILSPSKKSSAGETLEWASKELLDVVGHMRRGDRSFLTQSEVHVLLLDYIKRYNLRDPRRKSQVICDSRLQNLFGKSNVGHFEMLNLLDTHFLKKEQHQADDIQGSIVDTEPDHVDVDENLDHPVKSGKDKKRKTRKKGARKGRQSNLDDFAAVDMHNINLIYLRRSLVEDLLEDSTALEEKVASAFVRLRILGNQKQDLYRLVQVVGTSKAPEPYKVGKKTTDFVFEILNLDKTEVISIDIISNQDFTEDECKRLKQSIKCGLINRLTVGDIQEKAIALQEVRVKNLLEAEILRFSHLRDRASDMGRRKELRECVEKVELLKSPEERQRRLEEIPEIHADPKMDPDYESEDEDEKEEKEKEKNLRPRSSSFSRRGRDPISPRKEGFSSNESWTGASNYSNTSGNRELSRSYSGRGSTGRGDYFGSSEDRVSGSMWTSSREREMQQSLGFEKPRSVSIAEHAPRSSRAVVPPELSPRIAPEISTAPPALVPQAAPKSNDSEKIWHYKDPSGKVQGPFSMAQLRKWNNTGYFPAKLEIWKANESPLDSILLTDALAGLFQKQTQLVDNSYMKAQVVVQAPSQSNTQVQAPASSLQWGMNNSQNPGQPQAPTNQNSGWGQGTVNPNMGWAGPVQAGMNVNWTGSFVPPTGQGQGVPNPGWGGAVQPQPQPQAYPNAGWGVTGQAQSQAAGSSASSGWMQPTQGMQSGNTQNWGTQNQAAAITSGGVSGGNQAGFWGSQQNQNGGDSGYGWNRQSSGSGGGQNNFKGQRVCKFYRENGHCRKGASCNYLHN